MTTRTRMRTTSRGASRAGSDDLASGGFTPAGRPRQDEPGWLAAIVSKRVVYHGDPERSWSVKKPNPSVPPAKAPTLRRRSRRRQASSRPPAHAAREAGCRSAAAKPPVAGVKPAAPGAKPPAPGRQAADQRQPPRPSRSPARRPPRSRPARRTRRRLHAQRQARASVRFWSTSVSSTRRSSGRSSTKQEQRRADRPGGGAHGPDQGGPGAPGAGPSSSA